MTFDCAPSSRDRFGSTERSDPLRSDPSRAPPAFERGAGYAAGGGRWPGIALAGVVNALALLALLTIGAGIQAPSKERRISTFSLDAPAMPDDPVPEPIAEPVVADPVPVAPVAAVPVVLPQPPLTLRPATAAPAVEPAPVARPIAVQAAPAASVAAASAPRASAPITPPDFSAGQLGNKGPGYPYLSRKAREEGVVTLRVLVDEAGRAASLMVSQTSGHDRLDKAALDTVRKWRFRPASQSGHPVEAWVLVPITFSLQST